MLSPYTIQPNINNKRRKKAWNTNFNKNSHCEHDIKRPQMTSNDLDKPDTNTKSNKRNKNILEVGSVHENIENNEHSLDEILHRNDL